MANTRQPTPETKPPVPELVGGRSWILVRVLAYGGVILVFILMLLPAKRTAREAARRNSCMNNLKQISLALSNYESANGAYPPAYTVDADGRPLHSWRTLILPYMEQLPLYKTIDLTKPWDDPANERAYNAMPDVYGCPSDLDAHEHPNVTNYLAVVTPESVIRTANSLTYDDLPNPAQAILVIDAGPKHGVHWMSPVDADEQLVFGLGPDSELPHNGNIFLAMYGDGHSGALSVDVAPTVRQALITATDEDNMALGDIE